MKANEICYLTTFDNPFNPDTQFDEWLGFDIDHGYYSCAYLDRIARISPSMSEVEKELEIERAINEIIRYDFRNIYTKVYVTKVNKEQIVDEEGNEMVADESTESFDDLISPENWKEHR